MTKQDVWFDAHAPQNIAHDTNVMMMILNSNQSVTIFDDFLWIKGVSRQ
jgi:hypothetical protein